MFLTHCQNPKCPRYIEVRVDDLGKRCQCPDCGAKFEPYVPFGTPDFNRMIRYHLIGVLGKGGMGRVFRAWDYTLKTEVAVKTPLGKQDLEMHVINRFAIEVKALDRLSHPNICPIYDHNLSCQYPYFVMPIFAGGNLLDWLATRTPVPIPMACDLVRTLAVAMEHAHRHGVIHRDLKPHNILLGADDKPFITDFGLSLLNDTTSSAINTPVDKRPGTIRYMACEQINGWRDLIGPVTDVHALGIILFQLLTNSFPYKSTDMNDIIKEINTGIRVVPSARRDEIDPELDAIFQKATSKNIGSRYQSMVEFAKAINNYLGNSQSNSRITIPLDDTIDHIITPEVDGYPGVHVTLVPPGRFVMGSNHDREDESPARDIEITQSFWIGTYPITQTQYIALMGESPTPSFVDANSSPMESVTWIDAIKFCNVLSIQENLKPAYRIDGENVKYLGGVGYRLPTEAEWEYCCRAGSISAYSFGDNPDDLAMHAWYSENSEGTTRPVGKWPANGFGIHDMHGNVWEWCWDWHGRYAVNDVIDPTGPRNGTKRVLRGGSWHDGPYTLRCSSRADWVPNDTSFRAWFFGFRIARNANDPKNHI